MNISEMLPQIMISASDMPAWICYVKTGLVIVSAEHSDKFNNVVYMSKLDQAFLQKCDPTFPGFLAVICNGVKDIISINKIYLGFENEASFHDCCCEKWKQL